MKAKLADIPLGLPADEVLKRAGRGTRSRDLGLDPDEQGYLGGVQGHIFEWEYPWGYLVFKRRRWGEDDAHCYRVVEKREK